MIKEHKGRMGYSLYAANKSIISTYGCTTLTLNHRLRRDFTWRFIIADVTKPIIGADFLSHFELLIDLHNTHLIDAKTGLTTNGQLCTSKIHSIRAIQEGCPYANLLKEFPSITKPDGRCRVANHSTVHRILTTPGQPISSRSRRLAPDKLKVAKDEFDKMVKLGIARPSSSSWSSPLHLVPKKTGDVRLCGDYRGLNARTPHDQYPIRRLEDFTHNLYGKNVFSTIDLVRAFNQIPIAPKDI